MAGETAGLCRLLFASWDDEPDGTCEGVLRPIAPLASGRASKNLLPAQEEVYKRSVLVRPGRAASCGEGVSALNKRVPHADCVVEALPTFAVL